MRSGERVAQGREAAAVQVREQQEQRVERRRNQQAAVLEHHLHLSANQPRARHRPIAEAVHLETRDDIGIEEVTRLLSQAPGVELVEPLDGSGFATPVTHASGKDPVFVSRIRRDLSHPRGIDLWVVSDNVRKGAALNAVQIMQAIEARKVP